VTKPANPLPGRRCTATSKQRARANPELPPEELRCKNRPTPGALVCRFHGGASPQAKAGARARLLEASDPASAKLLELLDSDDEAVVLRAATAILDRSGHGPTTKQVNVDGGAVKYQIEGVDMEAL
jgi:hypothetical protein